MKPADEAVFAATGAACALVGWDYVRVGQVDPLVRAQVAWLAAYRHPRCGLLGVPWPHLREVIAQHPGGVCLGEIGDLTDCASVTNDAAAAQESPSLSPRSHRSPTAHYASQFV